MTAPSNLAATIDALGQLMARKADLELKEKALKADLKTLGAGTYEGTEFILTISDSVRENLDMKAVRDKLSAQFIRAHTTETLVRTLRTKARQAAGEEEG